MGSSFYIPAITIIIFILIPEKYHSSFYLFFSYEISIIIPGIFPEKKSDTVALELLLLPKYLLRIIYIFRFPLEHFFTSGISLYSQDTLFKF